EDTGRVQDACLKPLRVRREGPVALILYPSGSAADKNGLQSGHALRTGPEKPGYRGTPDCPASTNCHEVAAYFLHVDGDPAAGLGRIHEKQSLVRTQQLPYVLDGLNRADDVGNMG